MRLFAKFAGVLFLAATGASAGAALTGSSVTGGLFFNSGSTNYFDSAHGFVPAGFLNSGGGGTTVTISTTLPEFGFQDPVNAIRADFGASTLLISDIVSSGVAQTTYQFSDPAFSGLGVSESSDTFPGGMTASLTGTTLTVNYAGTQTPGTYNTVYVFTVVPEPVSLVFTAVAPLLLLRNRRA